MDSRAIGDELIRRFEGCRLDAYPDPATGGPPWTIGWGSTGPDVGPGARWTQAEADARLAEEIARLAAAIDEMALGPLSEHQKGALISFAYNVGETALARSSLARLIREGRFADAAGEFLRWNRAGGRVLPGLVRRRRAERAMFMTSDA